MISPGAACASADQMQALLFHLLIWRLRPFQCLFNAGTDVLSPGVLPEFGLVH
jgi:hypothetical protein